jgi:hypothetical protein
MKKKISIDFVIFTILIPLFLISALYISFRLDDKLPTYSIINKSRDGSSVFYEALRKLNYPVDRTLEPVGTQDINSIQIVAAGGNFNTEAKEVKEWVEKGGTLVYLNNSPVNSFLDGMAPELKVSFKKTNKGKGAVIEYSAAHFTNKALAKNTSAAYKLLEGIEEYKDKKIYFNESHLFATTVKKSFWDFIPLEIKFIIYQLILVIAAFFYYKGKRFGKTIPLYEEAERNENEYLYSAAALYKQAKCWDLMIDNYYNVFIKELKSPYENWLDYWEEQELPHLSKAKKIYEFMNATKVKPRAKEYMQVVTLLEQLTSILKKRRELYWKTLKRTQ